MSGGGVKGPWNKWEGPTASCAVGGHPFMPRKPLMPTQRPTLRAAGGGLFYNPPPAASRRVRGLGQRPKVRVRPIPACGFSALIRPFMCAVTP